MTATAYRGFTLDVVFRVTVSGVILRRAYDRVSEEYLLTGEELPYTTTYGPFPTAEDAQAGGVAASRGITDPTITIEKSDLVWRHTS